MKFSKPLCLWSGMYTFPKYSSCQNYRTKEISSVNNDRFYSFEVLWFLVSLYRNFKDTKIPSPLLCHIRN